jgi:hypothetical protein
MMPADQDDLLLRMLSRLPSPAPDAARSERIVSRCHAAMRRRDRWERQRRSVARRIVEPAVVGAFALAYLVAVVRDLWHWHNGL